MMKTILIAESGSTKTDWCLIQSGKKKKFQTQGINPFFQEEADILSLLHNEIKVGIVTSSISDIYFYGAGIQSKGAKAKLTKCLKTFFNAKKIHAESDMLAAVQALCGKESGITCILGTGSNSAYYNGSKISFKTPSLGYVLGDEGGATSIGKKVLQYYLHNIFDKELLQSFDMLYQTNQEEILESVYSKPLPNRFIAGFASFIFEHRGHYMIENIAEDCLNDFFINHLLRYPKLDKTKVHFCGSVAYFLQDILQSLCLQYDIKLGHIVQKPMQKLIQFHEK